jgi:hypothetical protein
VKRRYNFPKFKPEEHCRFCGHIAQVHMCVKDFGEEKMTAIWDQCDYAARTCKCPGFAPEDNLLYLEMLNENNS